jgi:hypothetical protein
VEHVNGSKITCKQFKKYFKKEYLSEHFYDKKMQEFFELRLGSMTMAEYEKKFLGLLKYVRFIGDEKVKIQIFLSGLPAFYKENIKYDEPKTLTESIRKAKYLYEQGQGRESLQKSWKENKMRSPIKGGKDSNLPSIGMSLIEIIKINMLRKIPWEKGEYHQSNVGDARKINCTRITHTERTK